MNFGFIKDVLGRMGDQSDLSQTRPDAQVNPGEFLSDWVNTRLPEFITGLATRVVDDGSGTLANEALKAGRDENYMGGVFR